MHILELIACPEVPNLPKGSHLWDNLPVFRVIELPDSIPDKFGAIRLPETPAPAVSGIPDCFVFARPRK